MPQTRSQRKRRRIERGRKAKKNDEVVDEDMIGGGEETSSSQRFFPSVSNSDDDDDEEEEDNDNDEGINEDHHGARHRNQRPHPHHDIRPFPSVSTSHDRNRPNSRHHPHPNATLTSRLRHPNTECASDYNGSDGAHTHAMTALPSSASSSAMRSMGAIAASHPPPPPPPPLPLGTPTTMGRRNPVADAKKVLQSLEDNYPHNIEEIWETLSCCFDRIFSDPEGKAEGKLTIDELSHLHALVMRFCMRSLSGLTFDAEAGGAELYTHLKITISRQAKRCASLVLGHIATASLMDEEPLKVEMGHFTSLQEVADKARNAVQLISHWTKLWNSFSCSVQRIDSICKYLNRYHIPDSMHSTPTVLDMGLHQWRLYVVNHRTVREVIVRSVVLTVASILCGTMDPSWQQRKSCVAVVFRVFARLSTCMSLGSLRENNPHLLWNRIVQARLVNMTTRLAPKLSTIFFDKPNVLLRTRVHRVANALQGIESFLHGSIPVTPSKVDCSPLMPSLTPSPASHPITSSSTSSFTSTSTPPASPSNSPTTSRSSLSSPPLGEACHRIRGTSNWPTSLPALSLQPSAITNRDINRNEKMDPTDDTENEYEAIRVFFTISPTTGANAKTYDGAERRTAEESGATPLCTGVESSDCIFFLSAEDFQERAVAGPHDGSLPVYALRESRNGVSNTRNRSSSPLSLATSSLSSSSSASSASSSLRTTCSAPSRVPAPLSSISTPYESVVMPPIPVSLLKWSNDAQSTEIGGDGDVSSASVCPPSKHPPPIPYLVREESSSDSAHTPEPRVGADPRVGGVLNFLANPWCLPAEIMALQCYPSPRAIGLQPHIDDLIGCLEVNLIPPLLEEIQNDFRPLSIHHTAASRCCFVLVHRLARHHLDDIEPSLRQRACTVLKSLADQQQQLLVDKCLSFWGRVCSRSAIPFNLGIPIRTSAMVACALQGCMISDALYDFHPLFVDASRQARFSLTARLEQLRVSPLASSVAIQTESSTATVRSSSSFHQSASPLLDSAVSCYSPLFHFDFSVGFDHITPLDEHMASCRCLTLCCTSEEAESALCFEPSQAALLSARRMLHRNLRAGRSSDWMYVGFYSFLPPSFNQRDVESGIKDIVAVGGVSSLSELLASAIHDASGEKLFPAAAMQQLTPPRVCGIVRTLYDCLHDKDVFHQLYLDGVMRRILSPFTDPAERAALEHYACNAFDFSCILHRVAAMRRDCDRDRPPLMSCNGDVYAPSSRDVPSTSASGAHSVSPLQPYILRNTTWPLDGPKPGNQIKLPGELKDMVLLYQTFYQHHYPQRKLLWCHHGYPYSSSSQITSFQSPLSLARVVWIDRPSVCLAVTTYQMSLLYLLNTRPGVTPHSAHSALKIPLDTAAVLLKSLHEMGVIQQHNRTYVCDEREDDEGDRVVWAHLAVGKEEDASVLSQERDKLGLAVERKSQTEAAIVRVMKRNHAMRTSRLITSVRSALANRFRPRAVAIQDCLEDLAEREYVRAILVEGQPGYEYLP